MEIPSFKKGSFERVDFRNQGFEYVAMVDIDEFLLPGEGFNTLVDLAESVTSQFKEV